MIAFRIIKEEFLIKLLGAFKKCPSEVIITVGKNKST